MTGDVANPYCPSPQTYAYRESDAPKKVCTVHPKQEMAFQAGGLESPEGLPAAEPPSASSLRLRAAFEEAVEPSGEP